MRAAKLFALVACLCALAGPSLAAPGARIVILPVVVHSASLDSGYVSNGISDMLSARLEQLGGVDVVRADAAPPTTSLGRAVESASELGGDYVVFGSFTQFGDGASLDIQCAPVEPGGPAARNIFIQSGTMGDIIPKLDELADKVARYVRGEVSVPAPAATANGQPPPELLEDLQRRLDALERAVFPAVVEATDEAPPSPTEIADESPES